MSLALEGRWCGRVYVVRCMGRIVSGAERGLEADITRALLDTNRIVLNAADVVRVDSVGMGMLVRMLTQAHGRGGDLRLAAPQPFLLTLLQMTKLHNVFRIHDSEDEAIESFLSDHRGASAEAPTGPIVLFLDQSHDLCAFVRKLLNGHGYQVLSSCRLHDAKLLLGASKVAYIILGPECSPLPREQVLSSLQHFARAATVIELEKGFHLDDAEKASSELLRRLQGSGAHA